jgi:hypothetical protein
MSVKQITAMTATPTMGIFDRFLADDTGRHNRSRITMFAFLVVN